MSPERTKRTKKKLGRSSVRLGLWQARQPAAFLCSCLGLLWGLSTFFVTSLEDNHQRRGRKLYFLESNEKEVERSKQTNPGTDLDNIWNSLEITLELKYRVIQKVMEWLQMTSKVSNGLQWPPMTSKWAFIIEGEYCCLWIVHVRLFGSLEYSQNGAFRYCCA